MSKKSAVILLLPLFVMAGFTVASVGAQGKGGGGGGVGNCKSLTASQWNSYNSTTGINSQYIYIACSGTPMSGSPVGWFVQYNGNAIYLTSTGTFTGGGATFTVQSIDMATGSNGIAHVSLTASIPATSYSVWGYPVCKRC